MLYWIFPKKLCTYLVIMASQELKACLLLPVDFDIFFQQPLSHLSSPPLNYLGSAISGVFIAKSHNQLR